MPANAGDIRAVGSIPGSRRCPGEENGNPLQCSWLENSLDIGAWWLQSMRSHRVRHGWSSLACTVLVKNGLRGGSLVTGVVVLAGDNESWTLRSKEKEPRAITDLSELSLGSDPLHAAQGLLAKLVPGHWIWSVLCDQAEPPGAGLCPSRGRTGCFTAAGSLINDWWDVGGKQEKQDDSCCLFKWWHGQRCLLQTFNTSKTIISAITVPGEGMMMKMHFHLLWTASTRSYIFLSTTHEIKYTIITERFLPTP